jgi:hypothetical protein
MNNLQPFAAIAEDAAIGALPTGAQYGTIRVVKLIAAAD